MADVSLLKGEEKTITITYEDSLDVSSATMTFAMKYDLDDSTALVTKAHGDFDMTDAATGIITFDLSDSDTDQDPGIYLGEVRAVFSSSSADLTRPITIWIGEGVI